MRYLLYVLLVSITSFAHSHDRRGDDGYTNDRHSDDHHGDTPRRDEHDRDNYPQRDQRMPASLTLRLNHLEASRGIDLADLLHQQYPFVPQRDLRVSRIEVSGDAHDSDAIVELITGNGRVDRQRFGRNAVTVFELPNSPMRNLALRSQGDVHLDRVVLAVTAASPEGDYPGHDEHGHAPRDHRDEHANDDRFDDVHAAWRSVAAFRTNGDRARDIAMNLPANAQRIRLVGTKRSTEIMAASIVFADGRRLPLAALEGRLDGGAQLFAWMRHRDPMPAVLQLRAASSDHGRRSSVEVFVTP